MPQYTFIGKASLSRGFSYPLNRSVLDKFLDDHGFATVTGVAYCGPSQDKQVLEADYRGARKRHDHASLTLWINAVPSRIRKYIAMRIEDEVFPKLADWMTRFVDESRLASQTDHRFGVYYDAALDDGTCQLVVRLDQARPPIRHPRYRADIRP